MQGRVSPPSFQQGGGGLGEAETGLVRPLKVDTLEVPCRILGFGVLGFAARHQAQAVCHRQDHVRIGDMSQHKKQTVFSKRCTLR